MDPRAFGVLPLFMATEDAGPSGDHYGFTAEITWHCLIHGWLSFPYPVAAATAARVRCAM